MIKPMECLVIPTVMMKDGDEGEGEGEGEGGDDHDGMIMMVMNMAKKSQFKLTQNIGLSRLD